MLNKKISNHYEWRPKSNISSYELALCIPFLFAWSLGIKHAPDEDPIDDFIKSLPKATRRHFVKREVD